jgi:hypothetical protein
MGGTQSTAVSVQDISTNIYNKNTENFINDVITSSTQNFVMESAKSCAQSAIGSQDINIYGFNAEGDITIDSTQRQQVLADFSCVNTDNVRQQVVNNVSNELNEKLKTTMTQGVYDQLENTLKNTTIEDITSLIGVTDKSSEVYQNISTDITNINERNVKNMVKTVFEINYTKKFLSDCVAKVYTKQGFKAGDLTAGKDITLNLTQEQAIKMLSSCIQETNLATNMMGQFGIATKIVTEDEFNTIKDTKLKSDVTTETRSGLFAGIWDFISKFDMKDTLLTIGVICCLCLFCILVIYLLYKFSTDQPKLGQEFLKTAAATLPYIPTSPYAYTPVPGK